MTQEQLTAILGPIWVAFEIALERLEDMREDAQAQPAGASVCRLLGDLDDARDYLTHRGRAFDPAGLMTVLQSAHGSILWPNSIPSLETQRAYLAAWLDRNPDIKAKRERRRAAALERLRAANQALDEKRARLHKPEPLVQSA